jgi:hypothetical protein
MTRDFKTSSIVSCCKSVLVPIGYSGDDDSDVFNFFIKNNQSFYKGYKILSDSGYLKREGVYLFGSVGTKFIILFVYKKENNSFLNKNLVKNNAKKLKNLIRDNNIQDVAVSKIYDNWKFFKKTIKDDVAENLSNVHFYFYEEEI